MENSYHNAIHAADVAQAVHVFLMSSLIDTLTMRPLEVLALLVCDVAHYFLAWESPNRACFRWLE